MIKLRRRQNKAPEIMISPMIDMMFLLLVFFILSTMYMTESHTMSVHLPVSSQRQDNFSVQFSVTIKKDGRYYLGNAEISLANLLSQAKLNADRDKKFSVVIRADGEANYQQIVTLLDAFAKAGISRVGLATESVDRSKI